MCEPANLRRKTEKTNAAAPRPGAVAVEPLGPGKWTRQRNLRDDFMMAALSGLLSNPENMGVSPDNLCLRAYRIADAALAAREA